MQEFVSNPQSVRRIYFSLSGRWESLDKRSKNGQEFCNEYMAAILRVRRDTI